MRLIMLERPTDTLGGDQSAACSYCRELRELGVEVEQRPANQPGDLSGADWVMMWSACSPDWGLPAAFEVKRQGKRLILYANWWNRDKRQTFYGKFDQDLVPNYIQGVAQTMALADVLFTSTMSEALECWKLAPRHPVYVIGGGCDPVGVDPVDPPQNFVSCIARVEKHKNQASLALACKNLGAPLVLVGEPVDEYYAAQCEALGATLLGKLSHADALEVLRQSRVHALPSFSETPGLANMEALSLGVPAVMGNIGAEPEFFGLDGIYCDPTNWRDVAGAVAQAWDRPRIPRKMPTWGDVAKQGIEWMEANQ